MNTIIPIMIFILILGVVIFIHELGHFLAARRAGIFVEEFALGMGPILVSKRGKKESLDGETTLFSLRVFPIGGFCKMRGMDESSPEDPEALNNKPIPARMLVMAGGSLMNFLLAFVLFFALVVFRGHYVAEIIVAEALENSPAYEAGLMPRDRVISVNETRMDMDTSLSEIIAESGGRPLNVRVSRMGEGGFELHELRIIPERGVEGYLIGIRFLDLRRFALIDPTPTDPNIYYRRVCGLEMFTATGEMFAIQLTAPFRLLARFAAGEPLAEGEGVMGPIGLGGFVADVYEFTIQDGVLSMFLAMVLITALINLALGVMNMLPIPALDGARLVFLLIEAIRKKPVPPEKEAMVHMVGLVALLALAVFIAYRDILRLIPGYPE